MKRWLLYIAFFLLPFLATSQHVLIIEVDGSIHNRPDRKEYDQNRDAELRSLQLTVLRFTNHEVLHNTDQVIKTISKHLKIPLQGARGL